MHVSSDALFSGGFGGGMASNYGGGGGYGMGRGSMVSIDS